eukprot:CAMPEP_0175099318 /NCGR_PEP_ID=MMETSP0086_2-20121207/6386_1 /TAXON_ID=136419 /ORGANISM="Unknown Unknown, Strain D1" /LENGTH=102 /DNA_ID=CAMNT_0016373147 /DNA_START=507 /DNA_END=819 /DNA_ORIENTATION=+
MADFRLCSTCQSRSQAGFCHCTQRAISDRSEPTFARLRYALGGDRPSQTTRHAGSRTQKWAAVRHQECEGWYLKEGSTATSVTVSMPTTYPAHHNPDASAKL